MRFIGELERVGQHDEIDAVLGEGQPVRIREHLRGLLEVDRQSGSNA